MDISFQENDVVDEVRMQLLQLVALFLCHGNPLIDCFIKKNPCVSDIELNVTCEAESDNYYGVTYFVSFIRTVR